MLTRRHLLTWLCSLPLLAWLPWRSRDIVTLADMQRETAHWPEWALKLSHHVDWNICWCSDCTHIRRAIDTYGYNLRPEQSGPTLIGGGGMKACCPGASAMKSCSLCKDAQPFRLALLHPSR